jgi:hypothetical protein
MDALIGFFLTSSLMGSLIVIGGLSGSCELASGEIAVSGITAVCGSGGYLVGGIIDAVKPDGSFLFVVGFIKSDVKISFGAIIVFDGMVFVSDALNRLRPSSGISLFPTLVIFMPFVLLRKINLDDIEEHFAEQAPVLSVGGFIDERPLAERSLEDEKDGELLRGHPSRLVDPHAVARWHGWYQSRFLPGTCNHQTEVQS